MNHQERNPANDLNKGHETVKHMLSDLRRDLKTLMEDSQSLTPERMNKIKIALSDIRWAVNLLMQNKEFALIVLQSRRR